MRFGIAVLLATTLAGAVLIAAPSASARARVSWPTQGQAAYAIGSGRIVTGPRQHTAPIASMAKVMTAYVVLRRRPLHKGYDGFRMRVTSRDVADYHRRVGRGESTVPVRAGEVLTERQALAALLLPSANNVAIMLARRVAGSVAKFVRLMNATARHYGMLHTRYTDPSGFSATTKSRPADQVHMARAAMRIEPLRLMVAMKRYRIPVAGVVHNTDSLLGHDGVTGIKTGSMSASGGCFMFRARRVVNGRTVGVYGVVMGQRGSDLVQAGLRGARSLLRQLGRAA